MLTIPIGRARVTGQREKRSAFRAGLLVGIALCSGVARAQGTAVLRGIVLDPSGAPIVAARVALADPLTRFERSTLSSTSGAFEFSNVPFHSFQVRVSAPGFAEGVSVVALRSNIPVDLSLSLSLAAESTSVTVDSAAPLVEPEQTGSHVQLNMPAMERFAGAGGRGIENTLVTLPGFAKNANGAIHPRGAHNQMTFVVDGMPISDQLTGAFANSVDPSIAQTVELFTGNIPAEYGGKTAAVVNITTKSGLGGGRPFQGNTSLEAARFDTLTQVTQVSGERNGIGYSAAVNTTKSNRFLDQVSRRNLHNGGNSERSFLRLDHRLGVKDTLRWTAMAGRSSFQVANLRSQHASGQDQRQLLRDGSVSLGWVRTLNAWSTFDVNASYRTSFADLFPSKGDTPVTAAQSRRLTTITVAARYNRLLGGHTLRAGGDYQRFPVRERFSFGIASSDFNDPGSEEFNPNLAPHDLSRGGTQFLFERRQTGGLYSGFFQDNVNYRRFSLALGLRYDAYRFLARTGQWQPRLGLAYRIGSGTSLRASYNRTFQTPPNENLLLSSSAEAGLLAPPEVKATLGSAVAQIRPETQNVFELGLQQAIGTHVALTGSFYHKNGRDQQDNNNFLNTGIIFPITLQRIRVNGAEARLVVLPVRGFSGSLSATRSRAISTPPFTGGLFIGDEAVEALSQGPFVIDHDQGLSLHGNISYSHRSGAWISYSARFDSGLVSNPSNPAVVAADPDYFDLLPLVDLAGNPPRVRPRTISDIAIGYGRGDRRRWEISGQITNLTGKAALYNFQSVFVGTRLVAPRAAGVRVRWYW